jgi:unsaturated rhamnogalacturonyl hydrolase
LILFDKMRSLIKIPVLLLLMHLCILNTDAQDKPLSERLSATVMNIWKDSLSFKKNTPAQWAYEQGVVLKAVGDVWRHTGNGDYFNYIKKNIDFFIRKDGSIRTYKLDDYNLDNINPGTTLLMLYNTVNDNHKYYTAINLLKEQLNYQPRTTDSGFWHKNRYPNQMWLDGIYMAEPFYAGYAKRFNHPEMFDDIAKQFILVYHHTLDKKTGLLYHAVDESKKERWADKTTGCSANFWGRSMGWYAMALVDVLDNFPRSNIERDSLIRILKNIAVAVKKVQDPQTGLWWQVLDKGGKEGNYLEASASSMFVYALAKGVREGYLDKSYFTVAQKAYSGIIKNFISVDSSGQTNLNKICAVAGLGGEPYRDGSYDYYVHEPVVTNDPKGLGACIMAAVEMEIAADEKTGKGKKVVLDSYFNDEKKQDEVTGQTLSWHYKWDETSDGGFSFLGDIFKDYGVTTSTLYDRPTVKNLKDADIYIIVDPDIPRENPDAKYIESPDVTVLTNWVKNGGVLVMLMNDTGNVEFDHANVLAKQFGIQFNQDSRNRVEGNHFEMGRFTAPPPIWTKSENIYLKQICTLSITPPAKSMLTDNGDVIIAVSRVGKGTVFAVGDPWFYNEYTDGRKLPATYQNFTAAQEFVKWLLKQVPQRVNK